MKKVLLLILINGLLCNNIVKGQWINSGNNYTSGSLGVGVSNVAGVQLEVASTGTAIFRNASYSSGGYINGAVNIFKNNSDASSVNTVLNLGNFWNNLSTTTSILAIDFRNGDGAGIYGGNTPMGRIKVQTAWVSPYMDFDLSGSTVMHLQDGNVGIGTTSSDAKLAVKGTVHANEVRVDLNGAVAPDYVFEKDYTLPSLEQVKSYIDQNKHLPEVPSAKEMEANGVKLGEMNMLLLKKVEELTLCMIEQNKRIDQQQIEIMKQNKMMEILKEENKNKK